MASLGPAECIKAVHERFASRRAIAAKLIVREAGSALGGAVRFSDEGRRKIGILSGNPGAQGGLARGEHNGKISMFNLDDLPATARGFRKKKTLSLRSGVDPTLTHELADTEKKKNCQVY